MTSKQKENPLLFSANVTSPFDNISSLSTQLIPPSASESVVSDSKKADTTPETITTQSVQPHLDKKDNILIQGPSTIKYPSPSSTPSFDPGVTGPPPLPPSLNDRSGLNLRRPTSKYVVPPVIGNATPSNIYHPIRPPFMPSNPPPPSNSVPFKPTSLANYDSHIPNNALATAGMNNGSNLTGDLSSSSSYSTLSSSSSTIIPTSFDNMASNPPPQSGSYHPVIHHWFYTEGRQIVWKPFSFMDSLNLEAAYREGSENAIPTDGGRYDVHIKERKRLPVYWKGKESPVMRCSWFRRSYTEAQPVPYPEEAAERLEEEYKDAMISGQWHRQVELPGGERVMFNSPYSMHHYHSQDPNYSPNITPIPESQYPQTVKRGADDFEIKDGEAEIVDHLLFLIHGIGSVCDLSFRPVEECVDDFRAIGEELLSTHFKESINAGTIGRVEILPISWHKALHGDETGLDKKLKDITLRSIPKLRYFTNDTLLDVFLYTSPKYCQHIMDTVASEMDRLLVLFRERNPSFEGGISLGGHSLGSVILFDLLMHQNPSKTTNLDGKGTLLKGNEGNSLDSTVETNEGNNIDGLPRGSLTSQVNFEIGVAGTGQPSIIYPQLSFEPQAFFMMGSPVGMFITVRGIDTLGPTFKLPTCDRVFNIFHPFDPVAYRIETLLEPSFASTRPVMIPHHKGRKRMHLELKDTIERVGSDIKNKIVDSIQSTWNRFYQLYAGGQNESVRAEVEQAVEEHMNRANPEIQPPQMVEDDIPAGQLNRGCRVDYVLQEKPYESFTEYIFALQAHVTYWSSEDTLLMILKELYKINGIESDSQQQNRRFSEVENTVQEFVTHSNYCTNPLSTEAINTTAAGGEEKSTTSSSSDQIPLLSAPKSPPPSTSTISTRDSELPRTLRGRPVFDPLKDGMPKGGMDPTAPPSIIQNLPPPPIMPNANINFKFKRNT